MCPPADADAYRALAAKLAPSRERDELLRKAREAEAAAAEAGIPSIEAKEQHEPFQRAEAAIGRGSRLVGILENWQDEILRRVRQMRFRATLLPRRTRPVSSLDDPQRRQTYEPPPAEEDEE